MNTTEEIPTVDAKDALIAETLESKRKYLQAALAHLDAYADIMARLPLDIINLCAPSDEWLQICGPSRTQVETILSALHAGRWEKSAHDEGMALDYAGTVDGVRVVIYRAEPPTTCRIEEVTTYVPAHNRIDRKLVCH